MGVRKPSVMVFNIDIDFDEEAKVFIATSQDITGLVLEAETAEQMHEYLAAVVPILLEENHGIRLSEDGEGHGLDMKINAMQLWLASSGQANKLSAR